MQLESELNITRFVSNYKNQGKKKNKEKENIELISDETKVSIPALQSGSKQVMLAEKELQNL